MDCVTEVSPTTSVTPPISPLKFVQPATSSTLPALKNLPTWNRTSLERKKHHRSLTRDVTELSKSEIIEESACRSTQTTPLANASRAHNKAMLLTKLSTADREQQNIVKNLERKLVFVQNQYEDVLFKLREEVGTLKKENMELTFQVVMKNGNVPVQEELIDTATSPIILDQHEVEPPKVQEVTLPKKRIERNDSSTGRHSDEIKIVLMDKELKSLRHALQEAKDKNAYLLSLIEKQKQSHRQRSVTKSGKHISEPQKINPPGNIGHQPLDRHFQPRNPVAHLPPVDTKNGRDEIEAKERKNLNNYNTMDSRPRDEIVNRLIVDDNKEIYEHKINHRDFHTYQISELRNGRYKGHLIEPFRHDMPIKKPVEPLPRLSMRAPGRSERYMEGYKSEGTTLPAVRGPAGSLMERQRRAHALHVQRQKTNREFTIFKLT